MSDPWIGRTLGRYQIERELGRGGMGVVYLGRQLSLNRPVAIKVLPPQLALEPTFAARFRQEAQVIASLVHENIVHVYDIDEAGGTYFIVMELISGQSLRSLREQRSFDAEEVRAIGLAVARALACAHQQGIVHRDVKSGNVMLTRDGKVKLMDFGIARVAGAGLLTQTGSILGTPEYMAPEQVRSGESTPRSDLYSLGVLLYELATGRLPFSGGDPISVALKHVSEPVPLPRALSPSVPPWLEGIILKALAKEPGERYGSAAELERDLGAGQGATAMAASGQLAHPPAAGGVVALQGPPTVSAGGRATGGVTGQTYAPVRAPRGWTAVALGVAAVALLATAWLVLGDRRSADRPAPADTAAMTAAAAPAPASTAVGASPPPVEPAPSAGSAAAPAPAAGTAVRPVAAAPTAASAPSPAPAVRRQPSPSPAHRPAPIPPAAAPTSEAAAPPTAAAPPPSAPAPAPAREEAPTPSPAFEPPTRIAKTFTCRESAEFHVDPEEAEVAIDGRRLGLADEWDGSGGGGVWSPQPGSYVACFSRAGLKTACVRIVIDRGARKRTCDVDTELDD